MTAQELFIALDLSPLEIDNVDYQDGSFAVGDLPLEGKHEDLEIELVVDLYLDAEFVDDDEINAYYVRRKEATVMINPYYSIIEDFDEIDRFEISKNDIRKLSSMLEQYASGYANM